MYRQQIAEDAKAMIEVRSGSLNLQEVGLPFSAKKVDAQIAGRSIPASVKKVEAGAVVSFAEPIQINAGETLTISTID